MSRLPSRPTIWLALTVTVCSVFPARFVVTALSVVPLFAAVPGTAGGTGTPDDWSAEERAQIESLSIDTLPAAPPSPGNPVADDERAVELGHRLFFDTHLSVNGGVACATCHQPARNFTDGLPRARAIGETARRTMTLVGAAWSPWHFWDGRRDSLWSQALAPLEHRAEHGGTRILYAVLLAEDDEYRARYAALFGPLPDLDDRSRFPLAASPAGDDAARTAWHAMTAADQDAVSTVFANIGRALEAYQRKLKPGPAPFDRYARALTHPDEVSIGTNGTTGAFDDQARQGLRLFIGRAQCIHCHNGPLFTNNEFHNTGLFGPNTLPDDRGRIDGVRLLLDNPFNCLGTYSKAEPSACAELRFVKRDGVELVAAFRTPPLRNVADNPPYMHSGQFDTLDEVVAHYDAAEPTLISDELEPLSLNADERDALVAFIESLNAPLDVSPALLRPPEPYTVW